MKKLLLMLACVAIATACGTPAGNNAPANNANTNKAASNGAPAPAVDNAAITAEIKKLVADYATSTGKNDADAYDKVTSDSFMFVGNDGAVQTKAERVASMKSGSTKYEVLTYDDVNVRVNADGNGAVVIAKATVKGTNSGKPIDSVVRVTQVWSKTKDGWKLASLQATDIKAPDEKKADGK